MGAARTVLVALLVLASSSDRVVARGATTRASSAVVSVQAAGQAPAPIGSDVVRIGVLRNGKYEIVSLPMEVYVARVLAGEAAPDSPPASLEALAIAIRTYTITNRSRHAAEGFDLCDQTHCQVMRASTAITERAALATAEQILLYRGAPATVFYSASCGGRSEKPSNVWPGAEDPPYLSIHDDDGCGGFPAWSAELAAPDLERAFRAGGFRGTLRDIRIVSHNDSGRVAKLALDGLTPKEISGQDLRMVVGRTLGFQHIQSTQFELRRTGRAFRFTGRGAGHGVGLCVIGSMKLAAAGQTATTILARYFPGTQIGPYGPRLTAAPPAGPSIGAAPPRASISAAPSAPAPVQPAIVAPPAVATPPAPATPSSVAATPAPETPTIRETPPADLPPPGDVVVTLSPGDASERAALAALIARERAAVAASLGANAPAVRVRVHETNASYERATGQAWFTLSALAADEVQLAPLRELRERGMLERAVRRQLVHLIVDPVLPARPAWLRDGAAVYFADPAPTVPARPPCPRDSELRNPTSVGALGDALGRARACFERQVSGGRDWRKAR